MNSMKKRYHTDDSFIAEPSEQITSGSAAMFDLMLEDETLVKRDDGTNESNQQIFGPTVSVTLAGTVQQACQDK